MAILTADQILVIGLQIAHYDHRRRARACRETNVDRFDSFYGSKPNVCAIIWEDLQTTDIEEARIPVDSSVHEFLMALAFLKMYPTENVGEGIFKKSKKTLRKWSWYYASKIQNLKAAKIVWPDRWNQNNPNVNSAHTETFLCTVDGVHCSIEEPKHPVYPKNPQMYSHKSQSAGLCYEIAISLWEDQVVWINGPFEASKHDATIFREEGLMDKVPDGKLVIADRVYRKLANKVSISRSQDTEAVRRLKGRAKARQESFNSRIKNFGCLRQNFRHKTDKHKTCFEAVCVICQYQLENGSPLFTV